MKSLVVALSLFAFASAAVAQQGSLAVGDTSVQHKPIEKATRGASVRVSATIANQAQMFTPLVFARPVGQQRYHGYPMVPRGKNNYQARLPASFLNADSFEYFIEVRHENGDIKSIGSAQKPYVVKIEAPVILPAKLTVVSDAGAIVSVDGKEIGPAPADAELPAGQHTISINHPDGRGAETQVQVSSGKSKKVTLPLPHGGGPGTLTLLSDPSGARILLDEQRIGVTPYQGEIVAGKHKIAIERDGYVRQEREVTFREGHDVEQSFSLTALPKDPALSVSSVPPGAAVLIDNKQVGVTPWLGVIEAGRHQLVLRKKDRRELASDFEMPDRDLSLHFELPVPAANNAPRLVVTSKPDGATVLVDGEDVGQTPWSGAVKPGSRKLRLQMAGFLPEEREIKAVQNREMEVSFALARVAGPAKVVIETDPPGAEVAVDGEEKGQSPITLEMEPGEHEIGATKAGFKGQAQKITVDNGQQASLRLALAQAARKPESVLAIATDPKGARLYVDGHLVGETPRKVKTTPGDHEVRLALDGYITRAAKVKLPAGKDYELRIAVSLKKVRGEEKRDAPDGKALAKARMKRAQSCDKQGDWDCALKSVYDYKPIPELLFNIAQIRRKKGDFKEAALAYRAFLKERPQGQLSTRAEQLAKRCEEVASGGAKNVAEDDTEPPKIEHTPIAKALRGVPLKLEAIITDNKSGVFNPQACFRNVYNIEYECTPLVVVGQDKYAVELPAKAVTDGFAYFLEAFDHASNGPARSGAPEVPHSVSIEDPAPPQIEVAKKTDDNQKPLADNALNEALANIKREQALQEGGPQSADPVVKDSEPDDKGVKTASAIDTRGSNSPGQGTLANQGGTPGLGGVLIRQPQAQEHQHWFVLFHLGAEQARERYTDSAADGRAGIELSRRVGDNQLALIQLDARTVRQPYRSNTAVPGQPAPATAYTEQRYGVTGAYGYDLGSLLFGYERLTFAPMLMVEYQRWQNDVFPANYFGLGVHLQARLLLAGPFAVVAGGGWSKNLVGNTNDNAVGTPRSDLGMRGGLEMAITEHNSLEVTYRGDLLTLANDYRFTNGISVGFGTAF